MLFTAIDRLIVIVFAEIHGKYKLRMYLSLITAICLLIAFMTCFTIYQNLDLYGDQMVTGCLLDIFMYIDANVVILIRIMIIMTCTIYLFVGIVIRIKSAGLPSAHSINNGTFRALFCIIAVNIGGYFILTSYAILIRPSISSPITAWFGGAILAIPMNIGAASNAPILYFTSTEYRKVFQKELQFIFKLILKSNRTAPQMQIVRNNKNLTEALQMT